jgi:ABC-2 type transport system ATP-binding protein
MCLAYRTRDRVRHLSGGQMRRVEIARALIHRPRFILLDEPTAGLDVRARGDILALTRGLVARDGVSVLWTTHLVDEVKPEDSVIVLHKGRVLASGLAREVTEAGGARSIGEAFARLTGDGGEEAGQ